MFLFWQITFPKRKRVHSCQVNNYFLSIRILFHYLSNNTTKDKQNIKWTNVQIETGASRIRAIWYGIIVGSVVWIRSFKTLLFQVLTELIQENLNASLLLFALNYVSYSLWNNLNERMKKGGRKVFLWNGIVLAKAHFEKKRLCCLAYQFSILLFAGRIHELREQ